VCSSILRYGLEIKLLCQARVGVTPAQGSGQVETLDADFGCLNSWNSSFYPFYGRSLLKSAVTSNRLGHGKSGLSGVAETYHIAGMTARRVGIVRALD
jgi:hypothetical protein